jgi:membrane protein required for colicin V production
VNSIDIILGIALLYAAFKGFKKGLIYQAASLAALVLGIFGAIKFSDYTASLLTEKLDITTQYLPILSFAITFIGIVIVVHLLAGFLEKIVDAVAMGVVNRIMGLVFGIIKAVFILSVFLVLLVGFDKNEKLLTPSKKEGSVLFGPVFVIAPTLFPYLRFEAVKDEIQGAINENKA